MIAIGAVAERGRLGPALVFVFIWSTIVYDPIACWTWNRNGWSDSLGVLDFAGGTPVHISSGTAALAISIYLGKRRGYGTERLAYKPHNTTYVILGTVFLWFGWFGFNGGTPRIRIISGSIIEFFSEIQGLRCPQTYGLLRLPLSLIWPLALEEPLGCSGYGSVFTFSGSSIDDQGPRRIIAWRRNGLLSAFVRVLSLVLSLSHQDQVSLAPVSMNKICIVTSG
jgi:hypothetical protein